MIITKDETSKTITIQYTDLDEAIYADSFSGGFLEGLESLLNQNSRQRRDIIAKEVLANATGPVSFVDKDDLVNQHFTKPEYKNAKQRALEAAQKAEQKAAQQAQGV